MQRLFVGLGAAAILLVPGAAGAQTEAGAASDTLRTTTAPAETMPGWLQPFVTYQPISVASDAVRALANGTAAGTDVLMSVGWTIALVAVFAPLSIRLYQKGTP